MSLKKYSFFKTSYPELFRLNSQEDSIPNSFYIINYRFVFFFREISEIYFIRYFSCSFRKIFGVKLCGRLRFVNIDAETVNRPRCLSPCSAPAGSQPYGTPRCKEAKIGVDSSKMEV